MPRSLFVALWSRETEKKTLNSTLGARTYHLDQALTSARRAPVEVRIFWRASVVRADNGFGRDCHFVNAAVGEVDNLLRMSRDKVCRVAASMTGIRARSCVPRT